MYSGSNCYPSGLRFSILAHRIKLTVCYDREELGLSLKIEFYIPPVCVSVSLSWPNRQTYGHEIRWFYLYIENQRIFPTTCKELRVGGVWKILTV